MLSQSANEFLIKLKAELILRGKSLKETNEILNELKDHLQMLETDGKDIAEFTQIPIKEYANRFVKDMSYEKELYKLFLGIFSFITSVQIMNNFLFDSHPITIGLFIYIITTLLFFTVIESYLFRKVIVKWGTSFKFKLALIGLYLISIIILPLINYYFEQHPIYEIISLNNKYSFIIGIAMFILLIMICLILKIKFMSLLIIINVISLLLYRGLQYMEINSNIITTITCTVYIIVFVIMIIICVFIAKELLKTFKEV
ncbi:hypothetical protein [Staphylococcus petrasii]|uniref:hypothetical protein n=2 Tax=Staphylococcus petrasii TaxID=1276936 RepID=UPI000DFF0769|nr:hypothetical protein [Staphylococcus petrasii]TGA81368.1 hypothetical protein E2554_07580 [Staphylococcus petrasii]SUM58834.1 membrane protein [Staphylococcus petrasii]